MTIVPRAVRKGVFENPKVQLFVLCFTILTLAIGSWGLVVGLTNQAHTARIADCNANYNAVSNTNSTIRAQLNNEVVTLNTDENNATASLILKVASTDNLPARQEYIAAYVKQQVEFKKRADQIALDKKNNPIPTNPKKVCK